MISKKRFSGDMSITTKSTTMWIIFPLILSIGITPVIPFSDAVEFTQICIDKVWIESEKGRIACVTSSTAEKLVERGWGTILSLDEFTEQKDSEIKSLEERKSAAPEEDRVKLENSIVDKQVQRDAAKSLSGKIFLGILIGAAGLVLLIIGGSTLGAIGGIALVVGLVLVVWGFIEKGSF